LGVTFTPASGSVGGTNYTYVLGNYSYRLLNLSMSTGTMMVTGRARLHVIGSLSIGGSAKIVVAPTGSLVLYVGELANMSGAGIVNQTRRARGFQYYGLPGNTNVTLAGNGAFVGVIYAPRADVSMATGGNDAIDFLGAIVANTVRVIGHYNVHYDENLARSGPLF